MNGNQEKSSFANEVSELIDSNANEKESLENSIEQLKLEVNEWANAVVYEQASQACNSARLCIKRMVSKGLVFERNGKKIVYGSFSLPEIMRMPTELSQKLYAAGNKKGDSNSVFLEATANIRLGRTFPDIGYSPYFHFSVILLKAKTEGIFIERLPEKCISLIEIIEAELAKDGIKILGPIDTYTSEKDIAYSYLYFKGYKGCAFRPFLKRRRFNIKVEMEI